MERSNIIVGVYENKFGCYASYFRDDKPMMENGEIVMHYTYGDMAKWLRDLMMPAETQFCFPANGMTGEYQVYQAYTLGSLRQQFLANIFDRHNLPPLTNQPLTKRAKRAIRLATARTTNNTSNTSFWASENLKKGDFVTTTGSCVFKSPSVKGTFETFMKEIPKEDPPMYAEEDLEKGDTVHVNWLDGGLVTKVKSARPASSSNHE